MKILAAFVLPALFVLLLVGCSTSSEVQMPEIPRSSPANSHSSSSYQLPATPNLREDAITRATASRLAQQSPAMPEMAMDHGGMKMDHSKEAPASADSYTCTMHPEIHRPAPGSCPICGMKLVKEKPATYAQ